VPTDKTDAVKPSENSALVTAAGIPPSSPAAEQHFSTAHLAKDLKGRTISSGLITAVAQGLQFALTLGSTMVLARLLTPRDFGLVAMVWTVMGFLRVFKEAGLSTATVQREGITHAQVSNLFWINLAVSGLITLLVAAFAPVIAWFYREPRLLGITIALSATFLLAGSTVQHLALLSRQMRFKAIAFIQVGSVLAGVVVGIGMAWLNYGYWSLVGLNLTTGIVALLLTLVASRWRPQFFTRRSGTRPMLHFGANLTAGAFFYSLARGLDGLLIGRVYGAASVGLYSRAAAMLTRPLEQFMCPVETVLIPMFSRLQNEPERYRRVFLQIYEAIALASFLFTGMFFALARPLTLVLLGAKWESAAIIFAGFTFAALQYSVTTSTTWLFASQGRGRDSLLASVIISVIMVISFIAGLPFGPAGVAIAYSAGCLVVQMPVLFWLAGRRGPVSTPDLWAGCLRHLPLWAVVCGVTWLVHSAVLLVSPLVQLAICVPTGLLAGAAFIFIYSPSRRVAMEVLANLPVIKKTSGGAAT
jgi:PST family polysaccharide transporter